MWKKFSSCGIKLKKDFNFPQTDLMKFHKHKIFLSVIIIDYQFVSTKKQIIPIFASFIGEDPNKSHILLTFNYLPTLFINKENI